MRKMKWRPANRTGLDLIDREHQRLIDAVNAAISAFNTNEYSECRQAIRRTIELARQHFDHEEAILREKRWARREIAKHAAYHQRIIAEIETVATLLDGTACHRSFIEQRLAELVHFLTDEICVGDQHVVRGRGRKDSANTADSPRAVGARGL